ncbi:MAG TPA: serine/threonine-protein kinase, partial [Planctomycetaceae bacterium]
MSVHSTPSHEDLVNAAIAEWLEAIEQGPAPDPQEFVARYPELKDELLTFLADRRRFCQFAAKVQTAAYPSQAEPAVASAGRRLGDFEIVREIGRGGMGIVYEARQISLNRTVALKVLNASFDHDPRAVQRFRREAEAAAMLRHANIVPIYATGEEAGVYYYAMELIAGPSLDRTAAWVAGGATGGATVDSGATNAATSPLVPHSDDYFARIAGLLAGAAQAFDHAHERGVVHRDVKPSNLLLAPDGRLCVCDFGLARIGEQPGMTLTSEV